jgi:hypothetical protein
MFHILNRFSVRMYRAFALAAVLALGVGSALGQERQIVTDAALNATLLEFEANFPQYLAEHPSLTTGASGPIHLAGTKGKITYDFQMEGQYTIDYGSIVFSPTDPISADRFVATLDVDSAVHTGAAALTIERKSKTYDLDCPNNSFSVSPIVFTCQVQVNDDGSTTIVTPRVSFDPKTIVVSVPCLQRQSNKAAEENLDGVDFELPDAFAEQFARTISKTLEAPPPGNLPNRNTLAKTSQALTESARSSNSSVSSSTNDIFATVGTAAAASATSPCGGTIQTDVAAIVADLQAISAQAQAQGFPEAMEALVTDLEAILPTLSPPNQALVQELVDDLEAAVSETGPGGTSITHAEEAVLELDLYNVILSTGITSEQSTTIIEDILAAVGTVEGISTAQLQADVQKLIADAQACAR